MAEQLATRVLTWDLEVELRWQLQLHDGESY